MSFLEPLRELGAYMIDGFPVTSIFLMTICITLLRVYLRKFFLMPLAKSVIPIDTKNVIPKLCESLWFFLYYTTATICSTYLWVTSDWFGNPRLYWEEGNIAPPLTDLPNKVLYLAELSNYISAVFFMYFLDDVRKNHKDKVIMTIHHFVTIALISVSYMFYQHRIGLVVLVIHDISDVFLEGSKSLKYLKFDKIVNIGFALFVVTFFLTRLVALPSIVLYPIVKYYPPNIYYTIKQCGANDCSKAHGIFSVDTKVFWLSLLGTLQVLHIYWFGLILRMVVYAWKEKSVKADIRSSDDENDHNDLKKEMNHTKKRR